MASITHLTPRSRPGTFSHPYAFCLMWYACECGHQERIWNSRDGATPFRTLCPSCGSAGMQHERIEDDTFAPDYRPRLGQRAWVSMSRERAEQIVDAAVATCRRPIDNERRVAMIASVYMDGTAPDLVVWQTSVGRKVAMA